MPVGHRTPSIEALNQVATAFRGAYSPRAGGISGPINIHFDVGDNYQTGLPGDSTCLTGTWVPLCAIIPGGLAEGGEAITETGCPTGVSCLFTDHPGTVSWKTGYRLIREEPPITTAELTCACRRLSQTIRP
jgi:hypothetical protein